MAPAGRRWSRVALRQISVALVAGLAAGVGLQRGPFEQPVAVHLRCVGADWLSFGVAPLALIVVGVIACLVPGATGGAKRIRSGVAADLLRPPVPPPPFVGAGAAVQAALRVPESSSQHRPSPGFYQRAIGPPVSGAARHRYGTD